MRQWMITYYTGISGLVPILSVPKIDTQVDEELQHPHARHAHIIILTLNFLINTSVYAFAKYGFDAESERLDKVYLAQY